MDNTITVNCPSCNQTLRVSTDMAGRRGKCRACGSVFPISAALEQQLVSATSQFCDDSVADWLAQDDGSQPRHPVAPPVKRQISDAGGAQATRQFPVHLAHVDPSGAIFTFDAQLLYDQHFRLAFPARCMVCGYEQHLSAHMVYWAKMQEAPSKGKPEPLPAVLQLDYFGALRGRELLDMLGRFKNMPEPFCLPLPYYVCNLCQAQGVIATDVQRRDEKYECTLTVVPLPAAEALAQHTRGQQSPEALRIRQVRKTDRSEPWRTLPLTVRIRLNQWYEPNEGEYLLTYAPDAEVSRDEAGLSGAVLSNKRLIYCKDGRRFELAPTDRGILTMVTVGSHVEATFKPPDGLPARLTLHPRCAQRLERLIGRLAGTPRSSGAISN